MSARRRFALAAALFTAAPFVVLAGPVLSGATLVGLALVYVALELLRPLLCEPAAGVQLDDIGADLAAER